MERPVIIGGDSDQPSVIIVGGLGSVAADWAGVVDLLGSRARFVWFEGIKPDLLPADASAPVRSAATMIRDAALAVGLKPPWVLVGHSLGGLYAQGFARLHPDLTAAVLLVDSTIPDPPSGRTRWGEPARTLGWKTARWLAVNAGGAMMFGHWARRLIVWSNTLHGRDPLSAKDSRRIYRDPGAIGSIIDELASSSRAGEDLASIAAEHPFPDRPVTILVCTRHGRPLRRPDTAWVRAQRRLASTVSAARCVEIDAAHLVILDQPGLVADAIVELLPRR